MPVLPPNPDKQDKCVNEVIFCQKCAENNFYLTKNSSTSTNGLPVNFTHDIKDCNNSILLGADLLLRYWEELSERFEELELEQDPVKKEAFEEICATVPAVIAAIRKSATRIETIITTCRNQVT